MSSDYNHLHLLTADDGRCLLLDIERDRILHLNPVGAEIWNLLRKGVTEPDIVTEISRRYQVSIERVSADVRALLNKISELRLTPLNTVVADSCGPKQTDGGHPSYPWYSDSGANRPRPGSVATIAALAGLAIFDFVLWARSLKSLCSYVNGWPLWRGRTDLEVVGRVCTAVERACVWYPKQALCLQRSAVTACLLKSHGIRAEMKIGMRATPFLAHAWVEVNGSIVNDFPGVKKFYSPLASC